MQSIAGADTFTMHASRLLTTCFSHRREGKQMRPSAKKQEGTAIEGQRDSLLPLSVSILFSHWKAAPFPRRPRPTLHSNCKSTLGKTVRRSLFCYGNYAISSIPRPLAVVKTKMRRATRKPATPQPLLTNRTRSPCRGLLVLFCKTAP